MIFQVENNSHYYYYHHIHTEKHVSDSEDKMNRRTGRNDRVGKGQKARTEAESGRGRARDVKTGNS